MEDSQKQSKQTILEKKKYVTYSQVMESKIDVAAVQVLPLKRKSLQ